MKKNTRTRSVSRISADIVRKHALDLASQRGLATERPEETVKRAQAFLDFLEGNPSNLDAVKRAENAGQLTADQSA